MRFAESIWYGAGTRAALTRRLLSPLSWLYAHGARANGWYMQRSMQRPSVPVLSIGNITVGGTGKTPMAAWVAARLRAVGAAPAIVMRGYGEDEPLVHAELNPTVPVVVDANRARGIALAKEGGADCVILDDGFQHRRVARDADWVLVAAEQWGPELRTLPGGPLREPVTALQRADVVIVTRKSASADEAEAVGHALHQIVAGERIARCALCLGDLRQVGSDAVMHLDELRGKQVLAIAAVGAPDTFFAQLQMAGGHVHEAAFADHHAFTPSDIARLVRRSAGVDAVVCTLKDAVKLGPQWPPAAMPIWYVSQHLVIEHGQDLLDHWIEKVLAARQR